MSSNPEKNDQKTNATAQGDTPGVNFEFNYVSFSTALAVITPYPYFLIWVGDALGTLWRPLGIVAFILLILLSLGLLLAGADIELNKEEGNRESLLRETQERYKDDKSQHIFSSRDTADDIWSVQIIAIGIIAIASFSQLCRYYFMSLDGFTATNDNFWHWLKYGVSNFLEGVLFDIPNIYEWNISEIQPTNFWTRSISLIFRTSLELLIIANIMREIKLVRTHWRRPNLTSYSNYGEYIVLNFLLLLTLAIWITPLIIATCAIYYEKLEFMFAVHTFIRTAGFVMLILFLIVNLFGLRLAGFFNKCAAIIGSLLTIWLISQNWRAIVEIYTKWSAWYGHQ